MISLSLAAINATAIAQQEARISSLESVPPPAAGGSVDMFQTVSVTPSELVNDAAPGAWFDMIGFDDQQDIQTSAFVTIDHATGVITFPTAGIYLITAQVKFRLVEADRLQGEIQLVNAADVLYQNAFDKQYLARDFTQDQGTAQITNFAIQAAANGTLKVQSRRVGARTWAEFTRLTILKVA